MVVYLDAVWLLNLLTDFLLLLFTAMILKRKIRILRISLAAVFASLIIFFMFTPLSDVLLSVPGKALYSAVIVWCAFGYKRLHSFLQGYFTFYFSAFFLGGGLFALHYFIQNGPSYANILAGSNAGFGDPLSWSFVVFSLPFIWLFGKGRIDGLVIRKWKHTHTAEVTIHFHELTVKATGFLDTGNHLKHPLSGAPVIFLSCDLIDGELPELWRDVTPDMLTDDTDGKAGALKNFTLIPFRSAGMAQDTVPAVKPKWIEIKQGKEQFRCRKVFVALSREPLSHDQEFDCILHPECVQRGALNAEAG